MALTDVVINDDDFIRSTGQNMVYVETDNSTGYKFRFLLELTYYTAFDWNSSSNPINTISFTQQKSIIPGSPMTESCVFNLSEILNTLVTPQITSGWDSNPPGGIIPSQLRNIHALPTNEASVTPQIFSAGMLRQSGIAGYDYIRGVANVVTCKFYEMYANASDGIPVKDESTEVVKKVYVFKGMGQWDTGNFTSLKNTFGQYSTSSGKPLLSSNYSPSTTTGIDYEIYIGKDELHTMAFFNRGKLTPNSVVNGFRAEYYNSSDVLLGDGVVKLEQATGVDYYDTASDGQYPDFYVYVGTGLENLNKLPFTTSSGAEYYGNKPADFETQMANGGYMLFTLGELVGQGYTPCSATYRFNLIEYCDRYEQSRLAYMNKYGAWEYITLNKKKEETLKVEREYITKPLLNQATYPRYAPGVIPSEYLDTAYPLDVAKRGKMAISVRPTEHLTLFTDNLKDYEINQIKDLMMSPEIHLLNNKSQALSLILETSEMKLKGEKNTGLYKYELKFSYANPINRKW